MDKMTINKQDLLARINQLEKQQEGIAAELKDLSGMVNNLPDVQKQGIYFESGEDVWFVGIDGNVFTEKYNPELHWGTAQNNRAFRSREIAELFAKKTQFIADALMWKELYDTGYVPNWNNIGEPKYSVIYGSRNERYITANQSFYSCCSEVYFSTGEIAGQFADLLNSRKRESNESSVTV